MAGRLWCLLLFLGIMLHLSDVGEGAMSRPRPQRPKKKPEPEEDIPIPPENNIDINQMMGKWYLLNLASKCSHLMTHGHNREATTMTLDMTTYGDVQKLSVKTATRHNHQCWEIHQIYDLTENSGYFIVKGNNPKESDIKVTILETDYTSYAILLYEKQRRKTRISTLKLYTRSVAKLHEPTLLKFEAAAATKNMGLAFTFPFPTYSHCDTVDNDHIINCIPTC